MKYKHFKIYIPRIIFRIGFFFCVFVMAIPLIVMLVQHSWNTIMFVCFLLFVIPFVIGSVWAKNYQIQVDGERITVRRGNGTCFDFETKEIQKVTRKITHTKNGINEKFEIHANHHRVSVEPIMVGYEQMAKYIREDLSAEIIVTEEITLSKPGA